MDLLISLYLIVIHCILTSSLIFNKNALRNFDHINLISDLKCFYNATGVFFIDNKYRENIFLSTVILNKIRVLSERKTFVQVLEYSELTENYNNSLFKLPRQLFIMPIETEKNLKNFENFSKLHELSLHVWLIVFWGPINETLRQFCEKPNTNRFNLNFDTLLLVKCYNNSNIREWYTVNNNKEVQMTNLMEWQPGTNMVMKSFQNLYRRRYDVAGSVLRVSSVKEHPSSLVNRLNGENHTMFTKIIIELASHMNFNLNFSWTDDFYGIWNESEKKWTGILGRLQSQEIDLAASEMVMTKERVANFDFTCPLVLTRAKLFIKQPRPSEVQWKTYLKAFDHKTWISLVILMILSATIITYMKIRISKMYCLKNYFAENFLYIWGIYCQQGLPEFPYPSSLRIAFVAIICSAIVFSALYSACIISYLAIFTPNVPFRSLPKYTKDGTYKLIVIKHSAEYEMFRISQDHVLKKMNDLMIEESDLPLNDVQAFEQTCQERVALYSNSAMKHKVSNVLPCKLYGVKTGRVDHLAFALSKSNQFTDFINYNILRFQGNGIIQRTRKMYYDKKIELIQDYNAVELRGIAPLLVILFFGMFSSCLILLVEKIYYNNNKIRIHDSNNIIRPEIIKQ